MPDQLPWEPVFAQRADRFAGSEIRELLKLLGRVRRSRGSTEVQTAQSHAIIGTPCEVPDPSTVTRMPADISDKPLIAKMISDSPADARPPLS